MRNLYWTKNLIIKIFRLWLKIFLKQNWSQKPTIFDCNEIYFLVTNIHLTLKPCNRKCCHKFIF